MTLVFRKDKASPLTYEDMDGNFEFLESKITGLEQGTGLDAEYIRGLFTGDSRISVDKASGQLQLKTDGLVTTVNGRSGDVEITKEDFDYTTDDIQEGSVNNYFTDARALSVINSAVKANGGLSVVSDESGPTIVARNFNIQLTGVITGNATVNELRDVVINTNFSDGVVFNDDGSATVDPTAIGSGITGILVRSGNQLNETEFQGIDFAQQDFEVVNNGSFVSISSRIDNNAIIEAVGPAISGTLFLDEQNVPSESGISVVFDQDNGAIRVAPRDFEIAISGAVSGSATVSRLRDVNISVDNINNYIDGVDVEVSSVKNNLSPITIFDFDAEYFSVESINQKTSVSLSGILNEQDVRDVIGETVKGTIRDVDTSQITETGIIVNYDAENNTLEVAPRDFEIAISGAVSGSATVSRLRDVNISVDNINNYIDGVTIKSSSNQINVLPVTDFDFNNDFFDLTVTNNTVSVSLQSILNEQDVRDVIGETVKGTIRDVDTAQITETGIIINYDAENNTLEVAPRDFEIAISGAVSGSATVSRLRDVIIDVNNINNYISGVDVEVSSVKNNLEPITIFDFDSEYFSVESVNQKTSVSLSGILDEQDVRDVIGETVKGTIRDVDTAQITETGIIVNYDAENNTLEVAPRDFEIAISGAVSGSATVSRLRDVNISVDNINNYISGVDVEVSSIKNNLEPITTIDFNNEYFSVESINQKTSVSLSGILNEQDVRDVIGETVKGTIRDVDTSQITETGIIINYDAENNTLEVAPRDFEIAISGAVSGSATVSRLRDVIIDVNNINNYIDGVAVKSSSNQINVLPVTDFDFNNDFFDLTVTNNTVSVSLQSILNEQDVRDIVGETVVGTERDINTNTSTETGIIVNYDQQNNVLEVAPRDFAINLTGDVTGSATVSRLRDVNISTVTDALKGIGVSVSGNSISTSIKNLDFSNNFTVSRDSSTNTAIIDIDTTVDAEDIRTAIVNAQTGAQDGIRIEYNDTDQQFSYKLSDLNINLQGAVIGTATLSYDGSGTQSLVINTEQGTEGSGVEVLDEGEAKGDSVNSINFVGAGVTSSVTVDGSVATVNIPNSPAAEKFVLIDNGSANVPNARKLTAGTGIVINDSGAGQNITISATGGEVLGKIQVENNGILVAEEATVNFVSTQEVFFDVDHDGSSSIISVVAYSKLDGWWREGSLNHGTITDKYGSSLDLGDIAVGIIEHQIDFGEIA